MWEALAGAALSAAAGAYGSNRAASAQEDAAKRQADTAYRNMLAQLQLQEPQRNLGYQALGDLSAMYGYSQAPYTSIPQLQNQLTKLGAGEVKAALRGGATFEQLQGMGTLGDVSGKQYKRLSRYLTPEQIQVLRTGPSQAAAAPAAPTAGATGQAGDMSRFFASPDYEFRRSEGLRGIEQGAAARGGALSGNALRATSAFNSNLASQEYGNYMSRLMQMAGLGSAATNNSGNAVSGYGNSLMGSQQQMGDARASGVLGMTNSLMGGINDFASWYGSRDPMQGLSEIDVWQRRI